MADDTPTEDADQAPADPPPADANGSTAAGFTQSQVDDLMGRTRAEAERKARAALLEEMGFTSIDEGKALRERQRAAELEAMSEAERAKAEAEQALAAAQADREKAARLLLDQRSATALQSAGCEQSVIARLAPTLGLPLDADDDTIAEAVAQLKATSPALFNSQAAPPAPSAVPSQGRHQTPQGGAQPEDRLAAGRALSEARNPTPAP